MSELAAPPVKKLKTSEDGQTPKEAVGPSSAAAPEIEEDMKQDSAPKLKDPVRFLTQDTTMNVMPCTTGNMLSSLCDAGFQYLVAGARANVGIKTGRYMFEAKIVEQINPADAPGPKHGTPKNLFRIGLSTSSSSLFLGEDANSVCFDMEGSLIHNRKRTRCSGKLSQDVMIAVVFNRETGHPNYNTISLFTNGVRSSQPQPLPEHLQDEILFPAVSFRNATVHVSFEAPAVQLPFRCRHLAGASATDVQVKHYKEPSNCKYNVVFPISLPDEGGFDWLDDFLKKNPDYVELSDRSLFAWAANSGLATAQNVKQASNDKFEAALGAAHLDDGSFAKMLLQVATLQPRNYVIMELRGNLLKDIRQSALECFKSPQFEVRAEVLIGEPSPSFRTIVRTLNSKFKQDTANTLHKVKKAEEKKLWWHKKAKRELQKKNIRIVKEKRRTAIELKKKFDREKLKAAGQEVPAELQESIEEIDSEDGLDPIEPEPTEDDPPIVTLNEEEENLRFSKRSTPDLTPLALSTSFAKFSLPDASEGFDKISFPWSKEDKALEYMRKWISDTKSNTRVEDISPSPEFKKRYEEWTKTLTALKAKQNSYKAALAKKAAQLQVKKAEVLLKQKIAELKQSGDLLEENAQEEIKVAGAEDGHLTQVEFEKLDVFGVSDIMDIGGGAPLFKEFAFEDFVMLSLRCEIHLLAHFFVKDCNDPDRTGVKLDHLPFYYMKYFGKSLNCKSFGVDSVQELLGLLDDTVWLTQDMIEPLVPCDMENNNVFVKITEEARRHRLLRLELGEESAKLNITAQAGGGGATAPEKEEKWQKSSWSSWRNW